jgi:F0F1-type ATP synthase membrane subunit b/b'
MTRAERDRLIADQHLIITLADGVCGRAYRDAEDEYEAAKDEAADVRAAAERAADNVFYPIKNEAEAEIARLEGLEVTE